MRDSRLSIVAAAATVCLALAAPPLRSLLEGSMSAQMLLQMPLLALAGAWLARAVPPSQRQRLAPWNRGGLSGLVLASVVSLVWMLPRALDASIESPWVALAKFTSVPLLIGLPFALSWPRMGFVVRGVFFAEAIAMCFRLGWLYLASPDRLCSNYLLGDQQRLGGWLLAIGGVLFLLLAGKLLGGHIRLPPESSDCRARTARSGRPRD